MGIRTLHFDIALVLGGAALLAACGSSTSETDSTPAQEAGTSGGSAGSAGSRSTGGSAGSVGPDSAAAGGAGGGAGVGGAGGAGGGAGAGKGGSADASADTGGAGDGSAGGQTCKNPVFVTSDPNGGWSDGGYYVHNNMWNSAYTLGPETLYACSYHDWYVVSNQTNDAGAVKTYPNVHKDYANVAISSFNSLTSTFAETSPHVGIYDVAYDIWTNGVATPGCTEFMIWNDNYKQVPAGSKVATVPFGGRTYDVYKTSNNGYIAFVPTAVFTSGTLDILEIFKWTMAQGWLAANSTLGQLDFGVEIVSTNGADATFTFTDFSITSN